MEGFAAEHSFARAASSAFEDAAFPVSFDDPQLPPLRLRASCGGGGPKPASPCSSSSDDDFVSMSSTPSGMLNPCGLWSPPRASSEASSSEMDFGTAREYDTADIFFGENWLYDDLLLRDKQENDGGEGEDKFIVGPGVSSQRSEALQHGDGCGHQHVHRDGNGIAVSGGRTEVHSCSFCYSERKNDVELVADPCSAVYGRYQIMDDQTEVLDECVAEVFRFRLKVDADAFESDLLRNSKDAEGGKLNISAVEKELHILSPYLVNGGTPENPWLDHDFRGNGKVHVNTITEEIADGTEFLKSNYSVHPFPESGVLEDVFGVEDLGTADAVVQNSTTHKFQEDPKVDPALSEFLQEYEAFELKIFHRKNRTGFEENKEFPIVMNSVIAGRYRVTEYLGSAAFSRVVRAHDLRTEVDVCLKIIKNDKDFFDQSLDEIKLLKYVNKYDPEDEHHVLRLYDYFYFQAIARQCLEALVYLHHLNIVHCDLKPENILLKSYSRCEIKVIDLGSSCFLSDNLISTTLTCSQVLFPNESVPIILARMIGTIGPIDTEMLALGQETQKYFTDDYDLFHKNEETDELEYLIPEKSSLRQQLQCPDKKFVDFLSYLLQINPQKRPTASEALQHRWVSFEYP
ncbi:hypothetical protein PR202_ga05399 [Eleusine coracana subsp. coracana]|uniref:Protein kinase domain-containing protein n=1 Tax=Eleusine coracana subsp. coracana TaxID=191504 RepID=A0AAV5BQX2_ELECO|nr:hypothetical protein PR202_ga04946 [Eleusine coracana subsp. coracana]GJM89230.1 hypothetical protein PR202_ga05399 [Eleusine coracana subsp. coracana]